MNRIKVIYFEKSIVKSLDHVERFKSRADLFLIETHLKLLPSNNSKMMREVRDVTVAYRDSNCKEKDFICLSSLNYDNNHIYINRKSCFVDPSKIYLKNYRKGAQSSFIFINRVSYGCFKFTEDIEWALYLYLNPKYFMETFKFEELNLPKETNQIIYFHIAKFLKTSNEKESIDVNLFEKTMKRCLDNLPDDLKLLLEIGD